MKQSAKRYAITGSWRVTNEEIDRDAREIAREIVEEDSSVAVGGAPGVDSIVIDEILKYGDPKKHLRVFLPIRRKDFYRHYEKKAKQGVISEERAREVISLLEKIAEIAPRSIIDNTGYKVANRLSYGARDTKIVKYGIDGIFAFQVNDTEGVQGVIDKAHKRGRWVHHKKYYILN
jgi:hypothetical protein